MVKEFGMRENYSLNKELEEMDENSDKYITFLEFNKIAEHLARPL